MGSMGSIRGGDEGKKQNKTKQNKAKNKGTIERSQCC
jgi:hypothetical protein